MTDPKLYGADMADLYKAKLPPKTKFIWTGEKRAVKPGEWYISGAKPCAYCAFKGTIQVHAIAKVKA